MMLRMHLPKAAVILKMQSDGLDPSLLDAYDDASSGEQSTPDDAPGTGSYGSSPVESEEVGVAAGPPPEMKKYLMMLRMHLPKAAVILKMQSDGLDPSLLDAYDSVEEQFTPGSLGFIGSEAHDEPLIQSEEVSGAVIDSEKNSVESDPRYAKYFKMLRMHLPKAAVIIKMQSDGIDPAILDGEVPAAEPFPVDEGVGVDEIGEWEELVDPVSGDPYFVNRVTQESSWTDPRIDGGEEEYTENLGPYIPPPPPLPPDNFEPIVKKIQPKFAKRSRRASSVIPGKRLSMKPSSSPGSLMDALKLGSGKLKKAPPRVERKKDIRDMDMASLLKQRREAGLKKVDKEKVAAEKKKVEEPVDDAVQRLLENRKRIANDSSDSDSDYNSDFSDD